MPIKQAAIKALRKAKKRTLRNARVKEGLAYQRKSVRKAFDAKDTKSATDLVKQTIKAIDKAVQKGVLKKNTGSRLKSRLMKKLNASLKEGKK